MVGMALANSLANNDFSVAIIENKRPKTSIKIDFDLRVSAITRETIDFSKPRSMGVYKREKNVCTAFDARMGRVRIWRCNIRC